MGRRKRVYSRSVENVNKARKTLSEQREQQYADLARAELAVAALVARQREQHTMQDEGEVQLWEANIIDSGDEGAGDTPLFGYTRVYPYFSPSITKCEGSAKIMYVSYPSNS